MACAEKRGKLWPARWRGPDGTLESKPGFQTRKDAETYGHDQEAASRTSTYTAPRGPQTTLTEWAKWYPALDLEPTTLANYRYLIEVHLLPAFGHRALPGITDGADVLAALCERHGQPWPGETFTVGARRGGLHLYFTAPPGTRLGNTSGRSPRGLSWPIDTRAQGGYVVAPGSFVDLPDGAGRHQVVYDRPPAPPPDWLAGPLTAPAANPPLGYHPAGSVQVRDQDSYVATALKRELERVRAAGVCGLNHALNKAAYYLGQLIPAGALPK